MCCASFPATVCDKDLTPQTPCLHDEDGRNRAVATHSEASTFCQGGRFPAGQDFEHNKTTWAWCDTYQAAPSVDECNSNGCSGDEWHCHCETKEGCLAVGRVGLQCR